MKLVRTDEKLVSENYPYGFRLRTTKTDYLEFDRKKGFRHCSFTVDPRNGKVNKPKKSTYSDILVMGRNEENGHVKVGSLEFYDQKDIDRIIAFFSKQDNFELFTPEQIEYIYIRFIGYIKASITSQVSYCGSRVQDLLPLYKEQIEILVQGVKQNGSSNCFPQIKFDWDKINSLKIEGYKPFKTTSYGI